MTTKSDAPVQHEIHIGDVADLVRGVTYKKQQATYEPADGYTPLLRATNIDLELNFDDLVYVPDDVVKDVQMLRNGDAVIAASSGSISVVGKAAPLRSTWRGTFGAFCYALRPDQRFIAPLYLSYFLQTSQYRTVVAQRAAGVNINNLKRDDLESMPLPIVPLPEQHRIVTALDSYFSRLDDAVATLERVQRNLKRYRASVLKSAVEGRLVPTEAELARAEGRDYEPASVLLERILTERRRRWEEAELEKMRAKGKEPKNDKWKAKYKEPVAPDVEALPELPEGWCWATVDQVAHRVTDGEHQTPARTEDGVLLLSARNVRNGHLNFDVVDHISQETHEELCRRLRVRAGDVLLSCSGTVGRSCVVPEKIEFSLVRSVAVLKFLLPMGEFMCLVLRSPQL